MSSLGSREEDLAIPSKDPTILGDPRVIMRLIRMENQYMNNGNYFGSVQFEITPKMRRELLEWLLEVSEVETCENQVFPLAVYFVDRYLSRVRIQVCHLQLLGCVCLLLASKLRQSETLRPADLNEYTASTYSVDEIVKWEYVVLNVFEWNLAAVTPYDYFDTVFHRLPDSERVRRLAHNLANKFQQMSIIEYEFTAWPPSLIALASIATAIRGISNIQVIWPHVDELVSLFHTMTNIEMNTISNCIECIENFVRRCMRRVRVRAVEAMNKSYDDAYGGDNPDTPPDLQHVLI